MNTIILYSAYTDKMSYYDDWVDAFKDNLDFDTECINLFNLKTVADSGLRFKIQKADVIVLHHSMNGDTLKYLEPIVGLLKDRKGKLVSFVGNEVNLPILGMAPKIKILKALEPEIIATQLLQEAGEWLYLDCTKSKVISLPHALNSKFFFPKNNLNNRKIDIGTRSSRYGVYIGDTDRNDIIGFFHENSSEFGLNVDLGLDELSKKRFNRKEWAGFLSDCKATLSTEAGSFFLERDDKLVKSIQEFLAKKSKKFVLPNETIYRKIYRKIMPNIIRQSINSLLQDHLVEIDKLDQDSDSHEIYEKFFRNSTKTPFYSKAISSRHFDAIGTKTLHIMYPGRYNDILIPGEHYFELKRDHSNVYEMVECLKDLDYISKITTNALDYVLENHTHEHRLHSLKSHLSVL